MSFDRVTFADLIIARFYGNVRKKGFHIYFWTTVIFIVYIYSYIIDTVNSIGEQYHVFVPPK